MSRKRFYLSTAAGFAVVLAASSASATKITYLLLDPIGSIGSYAQQTDITATALLNPLLPFNAITNPVITNPLSQLQFQKFNNVTGTYAGATLNYADVNLSLDYKANLTLTNTGNTTSTGTANTSILATLVGPAAGANTSTNNFTQSGNFSLAPTIGATTGTGDLFGKWIEINPIYGGHPSSIVGFTSTTHVGAIPFELYTDTSDPTDLAAFQGATGNASLKYTTVTTTNLSFTGGNASSSQTTLTDVVGSVTYDFTMPTTPPPVGVPEPMSAAVLMGGLASLAGIRRRRRS